MESPIGITRTHATGPLFVTSAAPQALTLHKLHGCGNDYLILDATTSAQPVPVPAQIRSLCDRRTGIGADGVIHIAQADDSTVEAQRVRMRIWNADGSESGMCGNGLRLVARRLRDSSWWDGRESLVVEVGERVVDVRDVSGADGFRASVVIGTPEFTPSRVPIIGNTDDANRPVPLTLGIDGRTVSLACLSVGNPHAVCFADGESLTLDDETLRHFGPRIETDAHFPERTNVGFAEVVSRDTLKLRVWERGVGETLACGSGACAAVVAGVHSDRLDRAVTVSLPGGELHVHYDADGSLTLIGPAEPVCVAIITPN